MKRFASLLCSLAVATTARSDIYSQAIKQAHRAADQTTAASGGQPEPAPTPPAATPAPTPMDPVLAATLQNISSLGTDLNALAGTAGSQADPEKRIALLNDLAAAAQGAKAAPADVRKLTDQLVGAVTGRPDLKVQSTRLARDLHALFNSSHLNPAQQETLLADVKKILTGAGTAADDAGNVLTELKVVAAATR